MSPDAARRWSFLNLPPGPILKLVLSSVRELSLEGCIETDDEKRVLGGEEVAVPEPIAQMELSPAVATDQPDPLAPKFETRACGWIGWKESKRERKRRDPWVCRQAWLYWEEPGGKKRSRYIPKAKLAAVEESVYGLKRSIYETLELLEKNE